MGKNTPSMSIYEGILLGLVQGLTEFLPVSSSGHLVIVQRLIHFDQDALAVDALLHFATLVAVVLYFRRELMLITASLWAWASRRQRDRYTTLAMYIVTATIPAAVVGVIFEKLFSDAFESVTVVGLMLILTGVVLWLAEGVGDGVKTLESMNLRDSLWVGCAQMAAIMPGLSRSGTTISAGLWRGYERREAAKFSFLLSIPIILGATLVALKDGLPAGDISVVAAAMVTAGVSGFFAIGLLMKIIHEHRLRLFSVYCFIMGSLALVLALNR